MSSETDNEPTTGKTRTTQARSKVKRTRILDSSRRLFARYGFAKTTIDDIARKAGVGKASLYYHFEGKEDIFRAVVRLESDMLLEKLQQTVDRAPDTVTKLRSFVTARYNWLTKLKTLNALTSEAVEEMLPLANQERKLYYEREVALLESILSRGVAEGNLSLPDPKSTALVMLSGLWGFDSMFMMYSHDKPLMEGIEGMMDLILWGMVPRDGSDRDQT